MTSYFLCLIAFDKIDTKSYDSVSIDALNQACSFFLSIKVINRPFSYYLKLTYNDNELTDHN